MKRSLAGMNFIEQSEADDQHLQEYPSGWWVSGVCLQHIGRWKNGLSPGSRLQIGMGLEVLPNQAAMTYEFNNLIRNGTWSLVLLDLSLNLVGCKCVYCIKHKDDGDLYKARLDAKEFHHLGNDSLRTFNLVVKPTTLCLVLNIALSSNWPLCQLDVNNAYLQSTLTDTIYMT
ncbi:cysteine-rich RLK (RECEPTOR-like protein kinase) 8 [Abeliophyllum distichum]|uniref:Cysteine-rich RLK (RECEPTOR-like protein kinase) 8 n=1 Tax=Abeliophyllum distichum TaxID=126358 RepID=A0ABD1US51_9LAMI